MIPAADTFTCGLVTRVCEAITITHLTRRKSPMVVHAHVTFHALYSVVTIALACLQVTEVVLRSSCITIARF